MRPRRRVLQVRVEALLAAAGPVHHAVAGYGGADLADDPTASMLAESHVSALRVTPSANAAEEALLAHARRVHASLGCRTFVVASGDHRFADLADLGRLEVVAWDGQAVAVRLEDAAHRIHRIPRPGGTPAETVDPGPLDTDVAAETAPMPAVDRSARTMATALLTGIGIGIGQRLVDLLLPRRR
ncbi:hypothetical protein [Saccharothrix australiensis]|uniref:hypothetical protein n=1 Tax=Saccharothrix australiensis TaxID=2072 RepID=UPI0011C4232B|nr:hypothetical protein [Saccharothrix australiensis]